MPDHLTFAQAQDVLAEVEADRMAGAALRRVVMELKRVQPITLLVIRVGSEPEVWSPETGMGSSRHGTITEALEAFAADLEKRNA